MVRQRKNTVNGLLEIHTDDSDHDPPPVTPLRTSHPTVMHAPRRYINNKVIAILLTVVALLVWLLFTPRGQGSLDTFKNRKTSSQFHLLLPASSSNKQFCRLLLSSVITNYPVPVLINWGAQETDDVYDMHILKIQKVLDYLEAFPVEQEDDLILIVDAYDVWFQLPPEVLINRYYEQIERDQEHMLAKYGKKLVKERSFQRTIYFSNDKACWPDDEGKRAACWAVPPSPLPLYAYGPANDTTTEDARRWGSNYAIRARWLNSGSIMGPVKDMRRMYEAVGKYLKEHHESNSDQFYFAQVWGMQEYARLLVEPNATVPDAPEKPDLEKEYDGDVTKAEFHMTLDYENLLFQPIGWYDPFVSFIQYDGSLHAGRPKDAPIPYSDVQELAPDIRKARPPLEPMRGAMERAGKKNIRLKQWHQIPLLTNLITKHTTPIIHFMVEKEYRVKWWDRMWYAPFSKDLFEASATSNLPILTRPINGRLWTKAEKPVVGMNIEELPARRDGAWSDKGMWLSWNTLCQDHEDYIFTADRRDSYAQDRMTPG